MISLIGDVSYILADLVSLNVVEESLGEKQVDSNDQQIPLDRLGVPSKTRNISSSLHESSFDTLYQPNRNDIDNNENDNYDNYNNGENDDDDDGDDGGDNNSDDDNNNDNKNNNDNDNNGENDDNDNDIIVEIISSLEKDLY